MTTTEQMRAAPHDPDNLLDRLTPESTLEAHYLHLIEREPSLLATHLGLLEKDQADREAVDVPAFTLPADTPGGPRFH